MSEQEEKHFPKKTQPPSSASESEEFDENFFHVHPDVQKQGQNLLMRFLPLRISAKEPEREQEFSWPAQQPGTEEFEQFEENYSTLSQSYKIQAEHRSQNDLTLTDKQQYDRFSREKADWEVGDIIDGRYEILKVVGQGGMGVVYLIYHREWDIHLAVKMPLRHFVADDAVKARFLVEAQTW